MIVLDARSRNSKLDNFVCSLIHHGFDGNTMKGNQALSLSFFSQGGHKRFVMKSAADSMAANFFDDAYNPCE